VVDESARAGDEHGSDAATDGAWKIFDAQNSWIERADVKASIILALEASILGFVVILSANHQALNVLHGVRRVADVVADGLLLLSVLTSLSAITPHLGRTKAAKKAKGIIYFGHLRHMTSEELGRAFRENRPTNKDVSEQVVILAAVSWRKHVKLQCSIVMLAIGVLLLTAIMAWPTH
jgi:hypothetical protein